MAGSEYYDHTTYPSTGSPGSSSAMRAELELIEAGFGRLPALSGNGDKVVVVNSGETALEAAATTGTGNPVRATSPTLVAPVLGTPASGTLTNCTGLPPGGTSFTATDKLLGRSTAGGGPGEEIPCTAFGRSLLDDASASESLSTLGITAFAQTLLDDASAADVRTTIGLAKGVAAGNVLQADQAETTVASAASVALASTTQNNITGTTSVGTFTGTAGLTHHCKATGALPLTHSAGLNILQTGASVTLDAGATFDVYMLTSNTCEVRNIQLASGEALIGSSEDYILIREEQASGTQGGTFTAGAWQTRVLNTEVHDAGGHASLSGNVVTLAAGTYRFSAKAPACAVDNHKVRLANTADSIYYYGSSEFTSQTILCTTVSHVSGRFTIAAPKTFSLQHYCQTTKTTNGFGQSTSFGVIEVYSQIEFWKEN